MNEKALIVVEVHDERVFPSILSLAERADLVILDRNGTTRKKLPTALKRVVSYTTTRGIEADRPNYSAFDGGTLRPIESLEDILRREQVSDVVVCGGVLHAVVSQTAFDARALGYATTICSDATIVGDIDPISPVLRLERAGIDVKQSGEIWT